MHVVPHEKVLGDGHRPNEEGETLRRSRRAYYHGTGISKIVLLYHDEKSILKKKWDKLVGYLQIENEYNNVQLAYRENGVKYIKWAGDMAVGLYNGVPWIMCKQKKHAPDTVVSLFRGLGEY